MSDLVLIAGIKLICKFIFTYPTFPVVYNLFSLIVSLVEAVAYYRRNTRRGRSRDITLVQADLICFMAFCGFPYQLNMNRNDILKVV